MEIEVKTGVLKTNAKGKIEMTRKEFREYLKTYTDDAMMITLLSCIAWLMEEPEFKEDRDRLNSIFKNVQRIIMATLDPSNPFGKQHLANVVAENTDIKVKWK